MSPLSRRVHSISLSPLDFSLAVFFRLFISPTVIFLFAHQHSSASLHVHFCIYLNSFPLFPLLLSFAGIHRGKLSLSKGVVRPPPMTKASPVLRDGTARPLNEPYPDNSLRQPAPGLFCLRARVGNPHGTRSLTPAAVRRRMSSSPLWHSIELEKK